MKKLTEEENYYLVAKAGRILSEELSKLSLAGNFFCNEEYIEFENKIIYNNFFPLKK